MGKAPLSLPPKLAFDISDDASRQYVEQTLFQVHKIAVDPDGGWLGPYQKIGSITIVLKTGKPIEIGISNAGFILGSKKPSQHNLFYSWGLAKILERHSGVQFDQWNFVCCLVDFS